MVFTLNMFVFTIALAFFLNIAVLPPNQATSPLGQVLNGQTTLLGALSGFFNNPVNILAFGGAIALGITFFPNMWAIFLLPTIALISWGIFPASLFNSFLTGVTSPVIVDPTFGIIAILNGMFQIAFVLSVFSWYKGQEAI